MGNASHTIASAAAMPTEHRKVPERDRAFPPTPLPGLSSG